MVYCVRHSVLPRLNTGAGVAFSFRCSMNSRSPLFKGLYPGVRR
ncbi:PyrBI operon leader peptide [Raoultella planticola]|nr:PyrBI operon leader peptide [Raoultella planticola]